MLLITGSAFPSYSSIVEGTSSYPNHLIILVHGISGNSSNWTDKTYSETKDKNINDVDNYSSYGGFKKYLEKPLSEGGLGLKGNVYAYTFSASCGSAVNNARELGDTD